MEIANRLRAGWMKNRSSIPGRGKRFSLLHVLAVLLWGPTYSPLQWINCTLSPDVKRPGHESAELYIYSLIRAIVFTRTSSLNIVLANCVVVMWCLCMRRVSLWLIFIRPRTRFYGSFPSLRWQSGSEIGLIFRGNGKS